MTNKTGSPVMVLIKSDSTCHSRDYVMDRSLLRPEGSGEKNRFPIIKPQTLYFQGSGKGSLYLTLFIDSSMNEKRETFLGGRSQGQRSRVLSRVGDDKIKRAPRPTKEEE